MKPSDCILCTVVLSLLTRLLRTGVAAARRQLRRPDHPRRVRRLDTAQAVYHRRRARMPLALEAGQPRAHPPEVKRVAAGGGGRAGGGDGGGGQAGGGGAGGEQGGGIKGPALCLAQIFEHVLLEGLQLREETAAVTNESRHGIKNHRCTHVDKTGNIP